MATASEADAPALFVPEAVMTLVPTASALVNDQAAAASIEPLAPFRLLVQRIWPVRLDEVPPMMRLLTLWATVSFALVTSKAGGSGSGPPTCWSNT